MSQNRYLTPANTMKNNVINFMKNIEQYLINQTIK